MNQNKIYISNKFGAEDLIKAKFLNANIIVCNEMESDLKIHESMQIINAESYRVEGSWATYTYNQNIAEELWQKKKSSLYIYEIPLKSLLLKTIYWTNLKIGALQVAAKAVNEPKCIVQNQPYLVANKYKEVLKYAKEVLKNNISALRQKSFFPNDNLQANIGILVNNSFELIQYSKVFEYLSQKQVILFHYGNIDRKLFDLLPESIKCFDLSVIRAPSFQKIINPFNLSAEALQVYNLISANWQELSNEIRRLKKIKQTKIRKLLVNVAENLPLRHLMKPTFGESICVYNTMNGLKSGEAHDSDIPFDKWFVWDQEMKQLLINDCGISSDKLLVSGHLSQDFISELSFKNTIGISNEIKQEKTIISIFSVRGKREEKRLAFEALYQFLETNQDYFLIVKPHPLESKSDYIFPNPSLENVLWVDDIFKNSKEALYDVLLVSDATVVFGSTVGIESHWMGVPCITFEQREKSFIYLNQKTDMVHVRSKTQFQEQLKRIQKLKQRKKHKKTEVAATIAKELCLTI